MTNRTAKILTILFAFFSFSAIRETLLIVTSGDNKILSPIAVILTAGFIWASIYFWKKSKRTGL